MIARADCTKKDTGIPIMFLWFNVIYSAQIKNGLSYLQGLILAVHAQLKKCHMTPNNNALQKYLFQLQISIFVEKIP